MQSRRESKLQAVKNAIEYYNEKVGKANPKLNKLQYQIVDHRKKLIDEHKDMNGKTIKDYKIMSLRAKKQVEHLLKDISEWNNNARIREIAKQEGNTKNETHKKKQEIIDSKNKLIGLLTFSMDCHKAALKELRKEIEENKELREYETEFERTLREFNMFKQLRQEFTTKRERMESMITQYNEKTIGKDNKEKGIEKEFVSASQKPCLHKQVLCEESDDSELRKTSYAQISETPIEGHN